ncbi:MAG: sulfatase-like hydrolase/transferase [Verrucomicrobiota bacterium]
MSRPNILFLLSDEHSFRFMSRFSEMPFGEPVQTPSLDRLAERSAEFMNAYCQMPLCTPSRLCLLTGREARRAGAWTNGSTLDPELTTLPQCLGEAGYATCLVGKMHLGGCNQMAGFRDRPYGDLTGGTGHQGQEKPDWYEGSRFRWRIDNVGALEAPESVLQEHVVAQETIAWVREQRYRDPETPWFLCASFSRPHFPLTAPKRWLDEYPPEKITLPKAPAAGDSFHHPSCERLRKEFEVDALTQEETMRMRSGYFACVSYLDEILGDLLDRLERSGDLDNTVIVYTSDHGELAGEHGGWWKHSFHEASIRVPLILSMPSHRKGGKKSARLETPVSLVDLFPTLCRLAGAAYPSDLDGRDLSESVLEGVEPESKPVVSDNLVPRWGAGAEFRMAREGRYKYVRFRSGSELLFDLSGDPEEQKDLILRGMDEAAESALGKLRHFVETTMDFDAVERERVEWSHRLVEEYPLSNHNSHGNHYRMPDGSIVYADGCFYSPDVIADGMRDIVGDLEARTRDSAAKV